MLINVLSATRANVSNLEQFQSRLKQAGQQNQDSIIKMLMGEAIPLTLQPRIEKARMSSFELLSHLQMRSMDERYQKKEKSREHYNNLTREISELDIRISNINPASSLDSLDKELGAIKTQIMPLTQQTPYTLLMMRVVEIGLPLLLSIFSVFFVLRYSLTEKRSHEIKDLLEQRNLVRQKEENSAGTATV
jgi:hypothetical protein